jgi:hypothetical protein
LVTTGVKHINLIEAFTQVAVGTVLIFISNLIVFPILGIEATINANVILVAINTVVAFIKSYAVRAFFRNFEHDSTRNV